VSDMAQCTVSLSHALSGSKIADIQVDPFCSVKELKRFALSVLEDASSEVILMFGGRVLADSDLLETSGIHDGSQVLVALKNEEGIWQEKADEALRLRKINVDRRAALHVAERSRLDEDLRDAVAWLCEALSARLADALWRGDADAELDQCFAAVINLLRRGAGTDLIENRRDHRRAGAGGLNVAKVFEGCVLAIDRLSLQASASAADQLSLLAVEMFDLLVVASGNAVRDNCLGYWVTWYEGMEHLCGSVTRLCRSSLFRFACFEQRLNHNKLIRQAVSTAAAMHFAWQVFEMQTLVETGDLEAVGPPMVKDFYTLVPCPDVACLDLFFRGPDTLGGILPLCRELQQRARRLLVFAGRMGALAVDLETLAQFHEFRTPTGLDVVLDVGLLMQALEHDARRRCAQSASHAEIAVEMRGLLWRGEAPRVQIHRRRDFLKFSDTKPLDVLTFNLISRYKFGDSNETPELSRKLASLNSLHLRALFLAAPNLAFELARCRMRKPLGFVLATAPGVLAELRHTDSGEDLLTWTCRQRGLTHRIVEDMLNAGAFLACGRGPTPEVSAARQAALAAAASVRNRRVEALLSDVFAQGHTDAD